MQRSQERQKYTAPKSSSQKRWLAISHEQVRPRVSHCCDSVLRHRGAADAQPIGCDSLDGSEMMKRRKCLILFSIVCLILIMLHSQHSIIAQIPLNIPLTPASACNVGPRIATSDTSYYLYPHNLHLAGGTTSAVPLRIIDDSGNSVSGNITFYGYDTSLISISEDGYVTGLRAESNSEIGTWVSASLNGVPVASTTIVRVLSTQYEIPFSRSLGANTVLYYPTSVNEEDLSVYITHYEIPTVNEYAYVIQSQLMGVQPFNGAKQVFEIDFGETDKQSVCGISGNPIRLGWNIKGNEWKNCFLVPFTPPRSPQWGVFYHEMGHNFSWASQTFARGLGIFEYSEAIATALGLTTMETVLNDPGTYPIEADATASLQQLLARDEQVYLNDYQNWLNNGANFSELNPNIIDGIWLYYKAQRPNDFASRFFRPLQPQYYNWVSPLLRNLKEGDQHTIFVALISAARGQNLSEEFSNSYHYPLNSDLFTSAYEMFTQIIEGSFHRIYLPLTLQRSFAPILLSLKTDPGNDWISPMPRSASMDIRQTSVWLIDTDHLRFEMQLAGAIPDNPSGGRFYGWFLDTDLNPDTGQQYNDIGSDFNIQVSYVTNQGWIGQIFDIGNSSGRELDSISISEDTVTFSIPVSAIGSPKIFNWISINQDDVSYYADIAPNTGHIETELPAR
jgi:hypothetical protein